MRYTFISISSYIVKNYTLKKQNGLQFEMDDGVVFLFQFFVMLNFVI